MANGLYVKAKQEFLHGKINLLDDTIKVALIDTNAYTVDLISHQYLSSVTGIVGTPITLAAKSVANGVFNAGDVTFTFITGPTIEACIIYKYTGSNSTSNLIAYLDTASGLPFTPVGNNLTLRWSRTNNKIFSL